MVTGDRADRWEALDADVRRHVDFTMGSLWPGSPLVFEATSPAAMSGDRLQRAVEAGLEVWLSDGVLKNPGSLSLRVLEPVIAEIGALHLESRAPVTDFDILTGAASLTTLDMNLAKAPDAIDLASIPRLSYLSGSGRDLAKLFPSGAGDLERLSVLSPHPLPELVVNSRARELVLVDLGRRVSTVRFDWPDALRVLTVKGATCFSAESVAECQNLEELDLNDVGELMNLRLLASLRGLKRLFISRTASREDWTDLLGVAAPLVSLESIAGLTPTPPAKLIERGWFEPSAMGAALPRGAGHP